MIARVILSYFWAYVGLCMTLPPVLKDFDQLESDQIDKTKFYEPNPPATHSILMVLEYFDEDKRKLDNCEITIELYGTVAPKTVKNFRTLAKGINVHFEGQPEGAFETVSYKDTVFHYVEPGKLIQGGDLFENHASFSTFGHNSPVENFELRHDRPGRVSAANYGPGGQESQFLITTGLQGEPDFDGKYGAFGQVVAGLDILIHKIQNVKLDDSGRPVHDIKVKYILVWDLALMDEAARHNEYLHRLQDFRNGDIRKGVTMGLTLAEGQEEEHLLDEMMFDDLHHPLTRVLIGISVLLLAYLGIKSKRLLRFTR